MSWRDYQSQFQFGCADGLSGASGLAIGLGAAHSSAKIIFIALLARAGSSSISMAGAQYQADAESRTPAIKFGKVAAMGLGYLSSAIIPGMGFAFGLRPGGIVFSLTTPIFLVAIAWFRSKQLGWTRSLATTFTIFVLAVGAGLLASWIGGNA